MSYEEELADSRRKKAEQQELIDGRAEAERELDKVTHLLTDLCAAVEKCGKGGDPMSPACKQWWNEWQRTRTALFGTAKDQPK